MLPRNARLVVAAAGLTAVCGTAPTWGADPSGIAIKVRQAVDVVRTSGQVMLRQEAPVFMGDLIRTGPVGETQIRLSDNTQTGGRAKLAHDHRQVRPQRRHNSKGSLPQRSARRLPLHYRR